MINLSMLLVVLCVSGDASAANARRVSGNKTTYGFFREVVRGTGGGAGGAGGARRVFGGAAAQLSEFPTACALLDRYFATRCSAAALASHWALTAAHCISPLVAYVKYNTRRPATEEGDVSAVHYLYRHPESVVSLLHSSLHPYLNTCFLFSVLFSYRTLLRC